MKHCQERQNVLHFPGWEPSRDQMSRPVSAHSRPMIGQYSEYWPLIGQLVMCCDQALTGLDTLNSDYGNRIKAWKRLKITSLILFSSWKQEKHNFPKCLILMWLMSLVSRDLGLCRVLQRYQVTSPWPLVPVMSPLPPNRFPRVSSQSEASIGEYWPIRGQHWE